ncbi:brain mitochondrial carrier protein 1 isoform X3 [Corvus cornix cornix]|uniref:brain mitochondrial carrier protein 1 isoform X3 n=1 Tax=Corvus cornix cornix TaxID=932674 RepID=UPI000901D033|nr:brain mitochondrial carrier protein 1 isoform X3 [Corvus cornix cornix]
MCNRDWKLQELLQAPSSLAWNTSRDPRVATASLDNLWMGIVQFRSVALGLTVKAWGSLVSSGKCRDETLLINVICGVVSGVISSALANPTDVLKIRMQAQGSLFQGGMIGSFIDIYQQEGTRGLWRGVVPTAQRAAIVVGVELPVYDITKKHLILSGLMGDTIFAHFVSSFTCGLAGAIASNPVDVVRTRMMNQRAIVGSSELYKGTLDGLVKTWKSEGFFALYKGFWPNWLRLGPWNIIFFITYEQLKRLPF